MNGYVYIFQNRKGIVKIGRTKTPEIRKKTLENMSGGPAIKFYLSREVGNSEKVEIAAHKKLNKDKVHGEWFCCEFDDARRVVEEVTGEIGSAIKEPPQIKEPVSFDYSLEKIDEEINEIKRENELLKKQLIDKGWSEFEVQILVRIAERDACEKMCASQR